MSGRLAVADRRREIVQRAAEFGGVAGRRVDLAAHLVDDVAQPPAGVVEDVELSGRVEKAGVEFGVDLRREGLVVRDQDVEGAR